MNSKLNAGELGVLQSLDAGLPCAGQTYRDADLPQRLFAFNLLTRQPGGTAVLTKDGERVLFRQACVSALLAIEAGHAFARFSGVRKWLLASGFIEKEGSEEAAPRITRRGRLWLASFSDDAASDLPAPTAGDFARRRA